MFFLKYIEIIFFNFLKFIYNTNISKWSKNIKKNLFTKLKKILNIAWSQKQPLI